MSQLAKVKCLILKDLKLMWRSKCWTFTTLICPILLILLIVLLATFAKLPKSTGRFGYTDPIHYNFTSEPKRHETYESELNKCPPGTKVDHYYDGRLTEKIIPSGFRRLADRSTPDEYQEAAEKKLLNFTGICDVNAHGYFMEDDEVTMVFPKDSYITYHYRIGLLRLVRKRQQLPSNVTMDQMFGMPSVISGGDVITGLLAVTFALLLVLPMMTLIINILNEKKVIQPYFQAIGLEPWFFYTIHYINGFIRLSIVLMFTLIAAIYLDIKANLFLFILFSILQILGATAFALLIGTIFKTQMNAILMLFFLWGLSVAGNKLVEKYFSYSLRTALNLVLCLNINAVYINSFAILTAGAVSKYGLRFTEPVLESKYPLIVYLSFMIFDTVAMIALGLFWDDILTYCSTVYLKIRYGDKSNSGNTAEKEHLLGDKVEPEYMDKAVLGCQDLPARKDLKIGIKLTNTVKVYSTGYRALNNVTMQALKGQVTCLLGANGAGKSTIFSMVSNITKPTSGSVKVYKDDSGSSMIGYCPQYDPLIDKLTVIEHLELVYALKGCTGDNFENETTTIMTEIGLNEKRNVLSKNLSGGMKRKLCVCMAMIGGSQIVLLDEPTAGMDPAARRDVQKILNNGKDNRTILLTTHFMDEAEAVGDWIFVLTYGKLAAAGTSAYLKKKFFDGFLTNVVVSNQQPIEKSIENMKALFQHFIPGSSLKFQRGYQLEMYIPNEAKKKFAEFLELMEDIMEKKYDNPKLVKFEETTKADMSTYTVTKFGLSETTLEQVLMMIVTQMDELYQKKDDKKIDMTETNYKALVDAKNHQVATGIGIYFKQLYSLLSKRFSYTLQHPFSFFFSIFLPLLFIYWFALLMRPNDLSTDCSFDKYPSDVIVQFENDNKNKKILDYLEDYDALDVKVKPFSTEPSEFVVDYQAREKPLGFILRVYNNYSALLHTELTKDAPECLSNILLNVKQIKADVDEHELEIKRIDLNPHVSDFLATLKFAVLSLGLILCFFHALSYMIEERKCQFGHLQKLTGVSGIIFWGASMLYDGIYFLIAVVFSYIMFAVYDIYSDDWLLVGLFFFLLFIDMILVVYIISRLFNSAGVALLLLIVYQCIFIIGVPLLILWAVSKGIDIPFKYLYYLNPIGLFTSAVSKIYFTIDENPMAHLVVKAMFDFRTRWGDSGLRFELIGFAFLFILLISIFSLLNSQYLRVLFHGIFNSPQSPNPSTNQMHNNSEAVLKETRLIDENNGKPEGCAVVIDKLVQHFGTFRAVNGISFTVRIAECFGLLGVNGAGKTTTFDILTGKRIARGGTVTIGGVDIKHKVTIGFCPQADALLDCLTANQCLYLFARLHRYDDVDEVVRILLECIGMTEHRKKQLKRMSGGQRRRISIGVAILSRSQCMILDEPTTGIDPIARRELWNVLNNVRQSTGTSIILTSHSMDECQALCGRITVLQRGEMIALGTSQDYMTEYGEFYTVVFVVIDPKQRETVSKAVLASLKDIQLDTVDGQQDIYFKWKKQKDDKWSAKFDEVAKLADQLKCDDFMLTQATLEDAIVKLTGGGTTPIVDVKKA